eukprot:6095385-Amphidinium_carterae.2
MHLDTIARKTTAVSQLIQAKLWAGLGRCVTNGVEDRGTPREHNWQQICSHQRGVSKCTCAWPVLVLLIGQQYQEGASFVMREHT